MAINSYDPSTWNNPPGTDPAPPPKPSTGPQDPNRKLKYPSGNGPDPSNPFGDPDAYSVGNTPWADNAPGAGYNTPADAIVPPPSTPTTPKTPSSTSTDYRHRLPNESTSDWVIRWANGNNRPDIANDPGAVAYWVKSIESKPKSDDMGYWADKLATPDNGNSALDGGGGGGNAVAYGTGAGFSTAGAANSVANAPTFTPTTPASPGPYNDELTAALWARAKQSLLVNPNDPIMQNQTGAFSSQQQQMARDALARAAEQAGPGGNISAETRAANEQTAQSTSSFQGALMQAELTARRKEIQDALNGLQGYLTDQQKMALQMSLAQMDNALQYARLQEQGYEFGANLTEQASEFGGRLGFDYAGLGQRAFEFDANRFDKLFANPTA